jgi:two-component system LytT family response regulator
MLRALIVDDEELSRDALKRLLIDYCKNVKVIAEANTVDAALEAIENYQPNLVFLDIEIDEKTGFDLLQIHENIDFEVIFTTAHLKYATRAFKFAAIDYLLKPIDLEELKSAAARAEQKILSKNIFKKQLEVFSYNTHQQHYDNPRIAIPTNEGLLFINVSEIILCEADGVYTLFFLKNGDKLLVSKILKEYEELLTEHGFVRVHHSSLINLKEVKKYVRGDGGYVVMTNGANVNVSKRRKEAFLDKISKA